jgi:primosomal protein N'
MEFIDLIIDNSSDQTDRLYTYGSELPGLVPGSKVAVSFSTGSRKKNAYVHSVIDPPEKKIRGLKFIEEMDDTESLPSDGIAVVDWMR